jgi:predicted branched-subunit amino acid permease
MRQLAPNPDIFGLACASLAATIALAVGFWQQTDGFVIAVRVGLVFVVTYAAVFLLVRFAIRTLLAEIVEQKRRQQEERRAQVAGGTAGPSSGGGRGSSSVRGRESQ